MKKTEISATIFEYNHVLSLEVNLIYLLNILCRDVI
jgi:hypothetical protein